jgi:hypothetical protein
MPDPKIRIMKGTIETTDGEVREFMISSDGMAQWGNTNDMLGNTVDALVELVDLLRQNDYLEDEDQQGDES